MRIKRIEEHPLSFDKLQVTCSYEETERTIHSISEWKTKELYESAKNNIFCCISRRYREHYIQDGSKTISAVISQLTGDSPWEFIKLFLNETPKELRERSAVELYAQLLKAEQEACRLQNDIADDLIVSSFFVDSKGEKALYNKAFFPLCKLSYVTRTPDGDYHFIDIDEVYLHVNENVTGCLLRNIDGHVHLYVPASYLIESESQFGTNSDTIE